MKHLYTFWDFIVLTIFLVTVGIGVGRETSTPVLIIFLIISLCQGWVMVARCIK